MNKTRLDSKLVELGLVSTRSQAESYIKLGFVTVNGSSVTKAGTVVGAGDDIVLTKKELYVNRAALKLESVADKFKLAFKGKVVLDVGSSTGGFTDYALQHDAKKVVAVDVGSEQMHVSLKQDSRVELHEKTDIRGFKSNDNFDLILIDVSFISLKQIMDSIKRLSNSKTLVVAMVKPQFETQDTHFKNKGVIKNEKLRREVLKGFETWVTKLFKIVDKADSQVTGEKGNRERFYMLMPL